MIKIVTIIGARPQIIKAAALSRAIRMSFASQITEIIVHTGQHYDENMSQVFFDDMQIPLPNYNLAVGSGNHGSQTAAMIKGIEEILLKEKPNYCVLFGDTNSTLAGAVAASKLHVPIAHIEAGLRSFNKSMPEEINRIMCDHVSTLLFSPTSTGYQNLINEGFKNTHPQPFTIDKPGIFHCGDVMYDNSMYFADIAKQKSTILTDLELKENEFILTTIHRDNNTDIPERLNAIFSALLHIADTNNIKVVLPLHPRTAKLLDKQLSTELYAKIAASKHIVIIPPASFLDIIVLEKNASIVITDSGGVQKEAFFFEKPCIILRSETEWTEIVENGAGVIANADYTKIIDAFELFKTKTDIRFPKLYGNAKAAEFICNQLIKNA